MSLPETCPFCGSGVDLRNAEKWIGYTCITTIHAGHDARRMQSLTCAGLERTRLLARVAELEARCKRLEEAGDAMLSAWLMPEDSMSYSDWVCLSSDAKSGWYAAKEAKP